MSLLSERHFCRLQKFKNVFHDYVDHEKKGDLTGKAGSPLLSTRSAAMTLCTAFLFAGLLKVSPVVEFLEGAFLVKLLFQSAESAIYGLAFFQSDFRAFHVVHPLPFYVNLLFFNLL